jgi:hypothetical protein
MLKGDELPKPGSPPGATIQRLPEQKKRFVARGSSNLAPIFIESADTLTAGLRRLQEERRSATDRKAAQALAIVAQALQKLCEG